MYWLGLSVLTSFHTLKNLVILGEFAAESAFLFLPLFEPIKIENNKSIHKVVYIKLMWC
jgi:hypothetical protein